MYKGLTAFCTTLTLLLIHISVNAEEAITKAAIPKATSSIYLKEQPVTNDIYLLARHTFYIESQIVDSITTRAKNGEARAQHQLGNIYKNGNGVTKSDIVALMWYIVSERNGHEKASENKQFTEQYMAFDQINLAYKIANDWVDR